MPAVPPSPRRTRSIGDNTVVALGGAQIIYSGITEALAVQLDAIRLIELGARMGLVCQLTGLERTAVNRLFRQRLGHTSPAGQLPFTDTWYLRNDRRMLHAALVWRLYRHFSVGHVRASRVLILSYESYLAHVAEPVLCLTRVSFVPRLVSGGFWLERNCPACGMRYLNARYDLPVLCPGCRWYRRASRRRQRAAAAAKAMSSKTSARRISESIFFS